LPLTREEFLASAGALAATLPQGSPAPNMPPLPRGFSIDAFDAALVTPAKHRHAVACISEVDNAVAAMTHTLGAYREIGVAAPDVRQALIFYHDTAVLSAYDDEVWKNYVVPSKILTKRPVPARSIPSPSFVCNLATHGFASRLAKALNLDERSVYEDMVGHLLPAAMLVPAGVWAIGAIAERGYTMLQYA
jgi:hypothetical protein